MKEMDPAKKKLVVIALGGNAISQSNEKGTSEEQFKNVQITCEQLVKMNEMNYKILVTHGNGPQAGNLLIQQEEGKKLVPPHPLDVVGAMTQGQIGYMFQNRLQNEFARKDRFISVCTVVTQVLVDRNDPDFQNPTKPVGPFYTKEEAEKLKTEKGYIVKEVKPKGDKTWRRVVPSPEPREIIEAQALRCLLEGRVLAIAAGGGGIPVMKNDDDTLVGLEAVIDKDKCGNVLAQTVHADFFLILTDVENACIHFGKPEQKSVGTVTVSEAEKLLKDGHFLAGSMGPKVTAAVRFVKATGKRAVITSLSRAVEGLEGKTGTIILPDK